MDISFIIPAHNEEKYLLKTVEAIKKSVENLDLIFEIIVVNNASSDHTSDIAISEDCILVNENIRGISVARNAGVKEAKYPILIFIDADTHVSEKLIKDSISALENHRLVSSITNFTDKSSLLSYSVVFYNIISKLFRLGIGQFLAVRKSDFISVGGFDSGLFAFEEIDLTTKVKKAFGFKSVSILSTPVSSSDRKLGKKDFKMFLFLLFAYLYDNSIRFKKEDLSFWYSEKSEKTIQDYEWWYLLICIILFFGYLKLLFGFGLVTGFQDSIGTLFMFSIFVYPFRKNRKILILAILAYIIEIIGVHTGFPFGEYSYGTIYSDIGVFGVPIFIAFAWTVLVTSTKNLIKNDWIGALLITLFDIPLEVHAIAKGQWSWTQIQPPLSNYISWFIISFLFLKLLKSSDVKIDKFRSWLPIFLLFSHTGFVLLALGNVKEGILSLIINLIYSILSFHYSVKQFKL